VIVYRWVEHTSELQLEIDARTLPQVFADAFDAFAELVGGRVDGEPARHEIVLSVENGDPASVLVEWLEELIFLAETEDFVPERLVSLMAIDDEFRAELEGRRGHPSHLVKAVTYHRLLFEERPDGWHARVVLDV
jgi:SHS2 domain-containing protein